MKRKMRPLLWNDRTKLLNRLFRRKDDKTTEYVAGTFSLVHAPDVIPIEVQIADPSLCQVTVVALFGTFSVTFQTLFDEFEFVDPIIERRIIGVPE